MVGIFIFVVEKHAVSPVCQRGYRIQSFLSIRYVHGDLCYKHLGMTDSTDQIPFSPISTTSGL